MGKKCCTCGWVLPLESFNRDKGKKDGRSSQCRECKKITDTQYRKDNKEAIAKCKAKNYQDNKDRINKHNKEYYLAHKQSIDEYQIRYRQENRGQISKQRSGCYFNDKSGAFARAAKHRAFKLNQTPVSADLKEIQFYYTVCNETNEILGNIFFHVDHIRPLSKGGLHHEDNLQILEASLNLQKNAKWPLTSEEQTRYKGVTL